MAKQVFVPNLIKQWDKLTIFVDGKAREIDREPFGKNCVGYIPVYDSLPALRKEHGAHITYHVAGTE